MLAHIDQDNIAGYFPVQSCSWAVGQQCTGNFLVQCWHRQIRHCIYRLFSCKNVSACSGPTLHKNFLVQCSLICIWTTMTRQYSYAMLPQHGRYNIVQVIFLLKVVCQPWANITWVISLCNVGPHRSRQHCRLFFFVQSCLWSMGQHCTSNFLVQC